MRFRKCENWGWFKGLIILSEQPIMIQQIAVCQKFYLKPKINKKLLINTIPLLNRQKVPKLENFKSHVLDTRNYKDLIKSSFSKTGPSKKRFSRVFLMVVVSLLPHREFGRNYHREYAPYLIFSKKSHF